MRVSQVSYGVGPLGGRQGYDICILIGIRKSVHNMLLQTIRQNSECTFADAWHDYHKRRIAYFVSFFFGGIGVFVAHKLMHIDSPLVFILFVPNVVYYFRLRSFHCPNCGETFLVNSVLSKPPLFPTNCVHCRLPTYVVEPLGRSTLDSIS